MSGIAARDIATGKRLICEGSVYARCQIVDHVAGGQAVKSVNGLCLGLGDISGIFTTSPSENTSECLRRNGKCNLMPRGVSPSQF